MTDDLELQAKSIFGEIVQQALSPDETQVYLDEACGENNELKQRIQILLDAYSQSHHLLDIPSGERAAAAHEIPGEKYTTVLDLPPFPDSNLGKSIGPYKLIERLGEGGMGIVYLAQQHEPIRRKVALKVIKPGMDSRQVLARFEAERNALALMDHPNIARVLDGGMSETGQPYFVMEYVKGLPITKYCDQMQMTIPERLKLFYQVCQAVQHAHQKGIIHRDLKPSNILICLYDGHPVPKVIDFGLAKALYQPLGAESVHTAHGLMVGTPRYMSPEQAELNNLDIDTRSDIYSLGVVLYELLTGSTPIEREHLKTVAEKEILRLIREYEPPRPSQRISSSENRASVAAQRRIEPKQLSRHVHGDLDWIVMKSLDKERHRRYDTATSLARDIERYLADEPVEACPPTWQYRVSKFIRRHRPVVAVTVLALIALLIATSVFAWQGYLIRLERNATLVERDKSYEAEAQANRERDLANAARNEADIAADAEREARQLAEDRETETHMILDFVLDKVLAATRPKGQQGGVKFDVTLHEALRSAVEQVEASFLGYPLIEARVRLSLGESFQLLGEYEAAQDQYQRARELRKQHLGENHAETVAAVSRVAGTLFNLGRHREALEMRKDLLIVTRQIHGPSHRETLGAINNIGQSLAEMGRYQDGVPLFEELLPTYISVFGESDVSTIRAMHNLAECYQRVGRTEEAIALANKALTLWESTVGLDYPDAIETSRVLLNCYDALGWYDEAIKIAIRNLPLCKSTFGDTHPMTLHSMHNLARCYHYLGYLQEAFDVQKEALKLTQQTLGDHHPNTLKLMQNVALSLGSLERLDDSLTLAKETLSLMETHLGPAHPDTLITMETVANTLSELGRHREALEFFLQLLKRAQAAHGEKHPFTLATNHNLALEYVANGDYQQAISLLTETVDITRATLGADHRNTLKSAQVLSNVKRDAEKAKELDDLRKRAEDIEATLGAAHADAIAAQAKLAFQLMQAGKGQQAVETYNVALQGARETQGEDDPTTIEILHNLAHSYASIGDTLNSVTLHEEVCEQSKRTYGPTHPTTLSSLACLGLQYVEIGRFEEGLALLADVYHQTSDDVRFRRVAMQLIEAHVKAGMAAAAADYAPRALEFVNGNEALALSTRVHSLENIGQVLHENGMYLEAVVILRESFDLLETHFPGAWTRFKVEAALGLGLLREGNYTEAESRLLSGTIGMKRTRRSMPEATDIRVREAIHGLIELYTALDRPDDVDKWQAEIGVD